MSDQLKTVIDRFYSMSSDLSKNQRGAILIITQVSPLDSTSGAPASHYKSIVGYLKWENRGMLIAKGVPTRDLLGAKNYPQTAKEIEAIATKLGFNAEGGSRHFNFKTRQTESDLNKYIKIIKGPYRAKDGYFLRSESLYNVASNIDDLDEVKRDVPPISLAYGGKSLHSQSHGESFLSIFFKRFMGNGLYILDEPESALSPVSQMSLPIRINELVNLNSQFILQLTCQFF